MAKLTEEDMQIVARAALAGVKFWRREDGDWLSSIDPIAGKATIGRAAALALRQMGLMPLPEYSEYEWRTWNQYANSGSQAAEFEEQ